jgi:imidazolonepropionase-like amidohydrolase
MGEREVLHIRGRVLTGPDDGDVRDELWVIDGRISYDRPTGTRDAVTVDGWVLPGLVDAHCHVGLGQQGAVDAATAEKQALTDRDAGTLLLRDAGSPSDTRWVDDREDLPRIIRAGRHIARTRRYIRDFAWEIEPEDLVAYVRQEARRGDGWVKLVGDWIDREAGDLTPCWPAEALNAAIARAHELGARVTAHVFGEHALPDLLAAGIDCIEHGTGIEPEMLALMAERRVAVVPTLIQLENFPEYADQAAAKFPLYSAHMTDLYERRLHRLRDAFEAGVPVYAGTDAGGVLGHGLIAQEIQSLTQIGMSGEQALAAGSWAARDWLGVPSTLQPGDPADLVVYDEDPRVNPAVLSYPKMIVLRGMIA